VHVLSLLGVGLERARESLAADVYGLPSADRRNPPSHQAEIKKVRDAWRERKPPEWIRVHALPGLCASRTCGISGTERQTGCRGDATCATCHGDVKHTTQVEQVSTLRMGGACGVTSKTMSRATAACATTDMTDSIDRRRFLKSRRHRRRSSGRLRLWHRS